MSLFFPIPDTFSDGYLSLVADANLNLEHYFIVGEFEVNEMAVPRRRFVQALPHVQVKQGELIQVHRDTGGYRRKVTATGDVLHHLSWEGPDLWDIGTGSRQIAFVEVIALLAEDIGELGHRSNTRLQHPEIKRLFVS